MTHGSKNSNLKYLNILIITNKIKIILKEYVYSDSDSDSVQLIDCNLSLRKPKYVLEGTDKKNCPDFNKNRCSNYRICHGKGNINASYKTHRVFSYCPLNNVVTKQYVYHKTFCDKPALYTVDNDGLSQNVCFKFK
jgi:hypothetical protein